MKTLKATATNKHSHQNDRGLKKLNAKTIYLHGDPSFIKKLGAFLLECAEQMRGNAPFHQHFRDFVTGWNETHIDVAVSRPFPKSKKRA